MLPLTVMPHFFAHSHRVFDAPPPHAQAEESVSAAS